MSLISVDTLAEIQGQKELGSKLQKIYRTAWNTLKLEHDSGLDGLEIITQLTRLMDEIIGFVFEHTATQLRKEGVEEDDQLTLLAL